MRIGLLGGTFNPIHNGHLSLAEEAKRALRLDKIILIPAFKTPHKRSENLIDAEERFRMIELAVGRRAGFEISRYEIDKRQVCYTVDTVRYFKDSYPQDTEIFFLIGADSLRELDTWKDIEELSRLCRFIVCNRPGFSKDSRYPWLESIDIAPVGVSSSRIRKRIKEDKDITGLLPEAVEDHIRKNNLYK